MEFLAWGLSGLCLFLLVANGCLAHRFLQHEKVIRAVVELVNSTNGRLTALAGQSVGLMKIVKAQWDDDDKWRAELAKSLEH